MISQTDRLTITRENSIARMQELVAKAEAENRPMNDSEKREFDQLDSDIAQNDDTLSRQQRLDARLAAAAPEAFPGGFDPSHGIREPRTAGRLQSPLFDTRGRVLRPLRKDESYRDAALARYPEQEGRYQMQLGDALRCLRFGPKNEQEMRAMNETTAGDGGYLVPAITSSELLDLLRPKSVALMAGTEEVLIGSDDHSFPKVATDPVAAFYAESEELSETDPTIESIQYQPKALATIFRLTDELLQDSAAQLNVELPAMIARVLAAKVDRTILNGSGSANEPAGVLNSSATGINSVDVSAALTRFDNVLDGAKLLADDNVDLTRTSLVQNPAQWVTTQKYIDTANNALALPPYIQQLFGRGAVYTTSNCPSGSMILADFSGCRVGIRSQLEVRTLVERYAEYREKAFLAVMRLDVQFTSDVKFCKIINIS